MKLLRILFYQAFYFAKESQSRWVPNADWKSVCIYIYHKLWAYLAILMLFVFVEVVLHPVVSMPVPRYMLATMSIFGSAIIFMSVSLSLLMWWQIKRHDRYVRILEDSSYDTTANRRIFYIFHFGSPFLIAGLFLIIIIFGIVVPTVADRSVAKNSKTLELYNRVLHSFNYEGTERDSIAAVSVIGAVDSLIEISSGTDAVGLTELMKFGVLTRARRFDEARDYVSEIDFAKDLDTPGCNDYLRLRINLLENRARGNGEALKTSARKMHDYLLKQVALPEFEMDSVLRYGVSADKPFAIRFSQLRMLKALTVYFKEPADTAELADRLRSLHPATEYQSRLMIMPDRATAEKIVYSSLPL